MKLGFTGTQRGMTEGQKADFKALIQQFKPIEFHHGDCIGADAEASHIVRLLLPSCQIVAHPPTDNKKRAYVASDMLREPQDYLARNAQIVIETDYLIAAPKEAYEVLRSGTWATVRYAQRCNKRYSLLQP